MFCRAMLMSAFVFALGCQDSNTDPSAGSSTAAGAPKRYRLAVIPKGTTHDFWKSIHAGAARAAEELGNVEIIWKGMLDERDKEGQIKLVEGFIVDRVDGICLAPIDRDALVQVVKRAKQRGIPVVIFDSGLSDEASYVSYVATDNRHGGQLAAEHLAKLLGEKGDVILVRNQEGSESTEQREAGFLETLSQYPNINMLSDNQRVNSLAEHALQISSSLLVALGDEVEGIFTVCEPINTGMLTALEHKRLDGKVTFVGFDSNPRFVQALRDGKMHGIVLQDPVQMGYQAVKSMVAHLEGEQVEKRIVTGEYLATPENVDDPRIHELLHPMQFDE